MSLTLDLSRTSPAVPAAPVNLSGLTRDELRQALIDAGVCPPEKARMRASQVWSWIHHYGVTDFSLMTNIGKDVQAKLAAALQVRLTTHHSLFTRLPCLKTSLICGISRASRHPRMQS